MTHERKTWLAQALRRHSDRLFKEAWTMTGKARKIGVARSEVFHQWSMQTHCS